MSPCPPARNHRCDALYRIVKQDRYATYHNDLPVSSQLSSRLRPIATTPGDYLLSRRPSLVTAARASLGRLPRVNSRRAPCTAALKSEERRQTGGFLALNTGLIGPTIDSLPGSQSCTLFFHPHLSCPSVPSVVRHKKTHGIEIGRAGNVHAGGQAAVAQHGRKGELRQDPD